MQQSKSLRTSAFVVCLMMPALGAFAQTGAVLRNTVENFGEDNQFFESGESYVTVTKVIGDRMRMDQQTMDGKLTTSAIFLGETDEMYMIDHDEKTYIVMDKEQIQAMAQQMSAAMAQMQEALSQVPEAQREMMERMMKGRMQAENYEPPAPQVVTDLGESGSVNGVSCDWKQLTRDGQLESKVCVADEGAIAGGKEMVALAHEMREFAEGLMQMAQSVSSMPMLGGGTAQEAWVGMVADVGGFSIIAEDFDGEGKLIKRSTFESADQVAIADEEFNAPSGYKRRTIEMPQMPR